MKVCCWAASKDAQRAAMKGDQRAAERGDSWAATMVARKAAQMDVLTVCPKAESRVWCSAETTVCQMAAQKDDQRAGKLDACWAAWTVCRWAALSVCMTAASWDAMLAAYWVDSMAATKVCWWAGRWALQTDDQTAVWRAWTRAAPTVCYSAVPTVARKVCCWAASMDAWRAATKGDQKAAERGDS